MNPTIERLKLVFLGVFLLAAVAVVVWQVGWAMPAKRCAADHKWWDHSQRVCATPILISDVTGRVIEDKEAEAAAKAAIGRAP